MKKIPDEYLENLGMIQQMFYGPELSEEDIKRFKDNEDKLERKANET